MPGPKESRLPHPEGTPFPPESHRWLSEKTPKTKSYLPLYAVPLGHSPSNSRSPPPKKNPLCFHRFLLPPIPSSRNNRGNKESRSRGARKGARGGAGVFLFFFFTLQRVPGNPRSQLPPGPPARSSWLQVSCRPASASRPPWGSGRIGFTKRAGRLRGVTCTERPG